LQRTNVLGGSNMTEAYYVSLAREYLHLRQALRKGVAAVSGDLAVLADQILIALGHPGDATFEIDRWARQVAAEQDALDHLELLAQIDDEIACDVCGERPAVLADDEADGMVMTIVLPCVRCLLAALERAQGQGGARPSTANAEAQYRLSGTQLLLCQDCTEHDRQNLPILTGFVCRVRVCWCGTI
jgi:hypothetical protein